jgi:hypothetical protein
MGKTWALQLTTNIMAPHQQPWHPAWYLYVGSSGVRQRPANGSSQVRTETSVAIHICSFGSPRSRSVRCPTSLHVFSSFMHSKIDGFGYGESLDIPWCWVISTLFKIIFGFYLSYCNTTFFGFGMHPSSSLVLHIAVSFTSTSYS